MIQTAMQDLKEDLILSKATVKNSLSIIENEEIKDACMEVVELTLNNIIKRIDGELLEMEMQQIINCFEHADMVGRASIIRELDPTDKVVLKYPEISAKQYYNKTYKTE